MEPTKRIELPAEECVTSLPCVEVTWDDAYTRTDHEADLSVKGDLAKFGSIMVCQDVGYLARFNSRELVLAVSRCAEDNSLRHSNTIPMKMIREIRFLETNLCVRSGRKTLYQTLRLKIFGSASTTTTAPPSSSRGSA